MIAFRSLSLGALVLVWFLFALTVKHFVCDFPLQTQYMLGGKGRYGHLGGILHALIHGLGTWAICFAFGVPWWIAVADMAIHYHVDWTKDQVNARLRLRPTDDRFWWLLGADQLAHQLTYVILASFV